MAPTELLCLPPPPFFCMCVSDFKGYWSNALVPSVPRSRVTIVLMPLFSVWWQMVVKSSILRNQLVDRRLADEFWFFFPYHSCRISSAADTQSVTPASQIMFTTGYNFDILYSIYSLQFNTSLTQKRFTLHGLWYNKTWHVSLLTRQASCGLSYDKNISFRICPFYNTLYCLI